MSITNVDPSSPDAQPQPDPAPPDWVSGGSRDLSLPPPLGGGRPFAIPPPDPNQGIWNRGRDQPTTVGSFDQPMDHGQLFPANWTRPLNAIAPNDRRNVLPPNVPLQPMPKWQPYAMPMPTRQTSQWGQPDPYAATPKSFELNGLYQNLGNYFGNAGMGAGLPGILMAIFAKHAQKAAMQGQLEQLQLANAQIDINAKQAEYDGQRQLTEFADVIGEYEAASGQQDPDKLGNYTINGKTIDQALMDKAVELNATAVQGILNKHGSIASVINFLKMHNANWEALHAANKQSTLDKEAQKAQDLADWGVTPGGAGAASAAAPASRDPMQEGLAPPAAAPPAAAPAAAAATTDPNAPAAQAQPASQPETQADRLGIMPEYQKQGLELLRGGNMTGVPKDVQPFVKQFATDKLDEIDKLVERARSGKMSKDQIEQELRKINPAIAGTFAGIRDFENPLPGGMGAINANPFWRDIAALAEASVPGWRVGDYQKINEVQRDYTVGASKNRMVAANNMANAAIPVLEALKQIPEGATVPQNWVSQIMARKFTGDPRWVNLFNNLQLYIQESQSLASSSGKFFETDVNRLMKEFDTAMGPAAIRGLIAYDAETASRNLQNLTTEYQNNVPNQLPPHYNTRSVTILSALSKLDINKGFADVPDLPPELQGLGMGQQTASPRTTADPPPTVDPPQGSPDPNWSLTPP